MIKRERYMRQICDFMDKPVVKVLTGMRRSGKSALLELTRDELKRRGVSLSNIVYINFESLRYESLREFHALYQEICRRAEEISGRLYILLDEIQEVENWEQAINSFRVDLDCDIYITGSNARLLAGELATLLAGRYVEIHVYPLDFTEYLEFAAQNPDEAHFSENVHFSNYIRYGGLPGIHQMKWEENRIMQYLGDIYSSVLLKDVISRNKIRDTALLEGIVQYLMDNIGNTFSAKTISDFLKNQGRRLSTETVYNYLKALENAFLIHKVSRYDIKGKRILETQEKYYLSDLGIRHAVLGYRNNDISGLLENIVFLELLRRGYGVYVGVLYNKEIDFVATKRDEKIYIQVSDNIEDTKTFERETKSLLNIKDAYPKILIARTKHDNYQYEGIQIIDIANWLNSN